MRRPPLCRSPLPLLGWRRSAWASLALQSQRRCRRSPVVSGAARRWLPEPPAHWALLRRCRRSGLRPVLPVPAFGIMHGVRQGPGSGPRWQTGSSVVQLYRKQSVTAAPHPPDVLLAGRMAVQGLLAGARHIAHTAREAEARHSVAAAAVAAVRSHNVHCTCRAGTRLHFHGGRLARNSYSPVLATEAATTAPAPDPEAS